MPARAELLKLSLLEKPAPAFTLKQDIFNGAMSAGGESRPQNQQADCSRLRLRPRKKPSPKKYSSRSVTKATLSRMARNRRLLNVSGEFFMVGEQDQILEKIKILKISKNVVTIEYENQPYDIKIKGDENG